MKVGFPRKPWWDDIAEEAIPAFEKALKAMQNAGVELVEIDTTLLEVMPPQ